MKHHHSHNHNNSTPQGETPVADAAQTAASSLAAAAPAQVAEASAAVQKTAQQVVEKAPQLIENVKRGVSEAKERVRSVSSQLDGSIRGQMTKNPYAALGVAMGVGFLLGSRWSPWISRAIFLVGAKDVGARVLSMTGFSVEQLKDKVDAATA